MPPIAHNSLNSAAAPISEEENLIGDISNENGVTGTKAAADNKEVDLLDGLFSGPTSTPAPANPVDDILGLFGSTNSQSAAPAPKSNGAGGLEDLLGGFNFDGATNPTQSPPTVQYTSNAAKDPDDILSQFFGPQSNGKRGTIAVNEQGIEIQLFVDEGFSTGQAVVRFVCSNNNPAPIENFTIQAAVTKVIFYTFNFRLKSVYAVI